MSTVHLSASQPQPSLSPVDEPSSLSSMVSKTLSTGSEILREAQNYLFRNTWNKTQRSFEEIDCSNIQQLQEFVETELSTLLKSTNENSITIDEFKDKLDKSLKLISPLISQFKFSPYLYYKCVLEFSRQLNGCPTQQGITLAFLKDFFSELRRESHSVEQWFLREDVKDQDCKEWYELILSIEVVELLSTNLDKNPIFIKAQSSRQKTYSLVRKTFRSVNWQKVFVVGLVVCIVFGLFFVATAQPTPPENVNRNHQNRRRNLTPQSPEFRIDEAGTTPQKCFVGANSEGQGAAVWGAQLSGDSTLTVQSRVITKDGPQGSQRTFRADDLYDFTPDSIQCKGNECVFVGTQPTKFLEGRRFAFNTTQVTDLSLTGSGSDTRPDVRILNDGAAVVSYDTGGTYSQVKLQASAPYPTAEFTMDSATLTRNEKTSITDLTGFPDLLEGLETNAAGNWDCEIQRLSLTNPGGFAKVGGRYSASGGYTSGDQHNLRMAKLPYPNQYFNVYDGEGPDGPGLYFTRMEGTTLLSGPTRFDSQSGGAQSGDIACDASDMCALSWQESGIWTRSIYHTINNMRLGITPTLVNDPGFMTGNTNPHVAFLGPDRSFMYNYLRGGGVYGRVLRDARVAPSITANTMRLPFSIPYGNNTFAYLKPVFNLQSTHPGYDPTELFYQFPFITGLEFRNELNQTVPIFSQAQYEAGNITLGTTSCNGAHYYEVQVCMPDYFCSDPVMPTAYLPLSFFFNRQFNLTTCTMPEFQRTMLAEPFQYGTFEALGSLPNDLGVQYYMGTSSYWLKSRNETAIQLANRALNSIYRFYQANETGTNFKLYYDEADKPSGKYLLLNRT